MIDERRFRAICRKEMGGVEGAKFEEALNASQDDPVAIKFEIGIEESTVVELPRADVVLYARIAREERAPEEELLKHIKPEAHEFVRYNRAKMIGKLKKSMVESLSDNRPLVLVWPLWTPDSVPRKIADDYVRHYG